MELDYTGMTDWELATILLKAGDEMERRRGGKNLVGRLTTLVTQVTESGATPDQIDSAVEYAKEKADESVRRRTPEPEAPITPAKAPVAAPTPAVAKAKPVTT